MCVSQPPSSYVFVRYPNVVVGQWLITSVYETVLRLTIRSLVTIKMAVLDLSSIIVMFNAPYLVLAAIIESSLDSSQSVKAHEVAGHTKQ